MVVLLVTQVLFVPCPFMVFDANPDVFFVSSVFPLAQLKRQQNLTLFIISKPLPFQLV